MLKFKVIHKYRDCTIVSLPVEEFIKVTIHDDLTNEQICEEYFSESTPLTTQQVMTECELIIDNYVQTIENLGIEK